MPPEMSVQAYLAQQVPVPGMELDRFLAAVHGKFRQADADSDGEISQADVTLHAEIARAGTRALFAMQIMRADLNNDGAVTEDELRRVLQYDRRMINPSQQDPMRGTVDAQIRKLMAADINHDGRVTYAEAEAFFDPQPVDMRLLDRMSETARQFLKFAPSGKNVATLADVDGLIMRRSYCSRTAKLVFGDRTVVIQIGSHDLHEKARGCRPARDFRHGLGHVGLRNLTVSN